MGKKLLDSDDSHDEQNNSDSGDEDAKLDGKLFNSNKPRVEKTSSFVQRVDPEKDEYDSEDSNRAAMF
tara:strand:+ start:494 stop:697 length:204 start_codon:yes stop_codon:yes gene_type:complete